MKRETTTLSNLIIILMTIGTILIATFARSEGVKPERQKVKYTKSNIGQYFKDIEFSADSNYCIVGTDTTQTNYSVIFLN